MSASYEAATTPSATLVAGESTALDVKANQSKSMNVVLKASTVR